MISTLNQTFSQGPCYFRVIHHYTHLTRKLGGILKGKSFSQLYYPSCNIPLSVLFLSFIVIFSQQRRGDFIYMYIVSFELYCCLHCCIFHLAQKKRVHSNVTLFAKCVSLLRYLEVLWKSRWDLNLKILRGGGAQAVLEIWMERRGEKCLPSGGRGVGVFSGIAHCHSMSGFVGNFSLK